ncbi:uncharacterized protein LOC104453935 isoform X2 [Eucalyptus grandis]|uniref:uncharacterized protein LOC104453935 isoform X2 n=1 Tax=Eucalyptus grandis TaxID=71139 RepID=UPI00192E8022|nr:uncharacterized protein LOC104453935 isoform X2 [Eucalyptus grandis]
MAKPGLLDLEKHFAFYGAYHSNPVNVAIHMVFVWPILFTALLLLCYAPPLFGLPPIELSLFGHGLALFLNVGCLLALVYAAFYVFLDPRAGSLAALLCLMCWVAASFVAGRLGFSLAWKLCPHPRNVGNARAVRLHIGRWSEKRLYIGSVVSLSRIGSFFWCCIRHSCTFVFGVLAFDDGGAILVVARSVVVVRF